MFPRYRGLSTEATPVLASPPRLRLACDLVGKARSMELLDTTAAVETPERVHFRHRLAGPGRRAAAWFVDTLIRVVVFVVLTIIVLIGAGNDLMFGAGIGLLLVVLFVFEWLYNVLFETFMDGRTPGKMLLELRVVRGDGSPGRFPDFLLRNLLRGIDFLPFGFGIGVIVMLFDRRMRRLGDLVADTVVVAESRRTMLDGVRIEPPLSEEERRALPARVDLRRDEMALIEEYLRRRRRLGPERAEELAWLYGPRLAERTGIQAPTWDRVLVLAWICAKGRNHD